MKAEVDMMTFVLQGSVVSIGTFALLNAMLLLVHRAGWFQQYKIQGSKEPEESLYQQARSSAIFGMLFATPPFHVIVWLVLRPIITNDVPSVTSVICSILAYILIADTLFYWSHRMLHMKQFYWIHKRHHSFTTTVGFASVYSHPIEGTINSIITYSGPAVLGLLGYDMPMITLWIWYLIRWAETTDAHSGYEFPFSPFGLFSVAGHHDFHHSHNIGCYGSFFGMWDKLCGTDAAYKKWKLEKEPAKGLLVKEPAKELLVKEPVVQRG
jgi:sterol desaturase/sphingolipid hydroxylase (fatty acid hydroxylase superfamily)